MNFPSHTVVPSCFRLEQSQLSMFVDRKLGSNYDSAELEEMVQIALLCTMYSPCYRPKMSEIVKMLEGGDGVAEKMGGHEKY